MSASSECRIFVYDNLLSGEPDHQWLSKATLLGTARTAAVFHLVEVGVYGALIAGGTTSVVGELYLVDRKTRAELDVRREVPILFRRIRIQLEDGSEAETYVMDAEQVRGKRRLHHGDWRARFLPRVAQGYSRPRVRWARPR